MATSTIPQRLVDETPVPEQHYLPPTEYCPNNPMPIIIYRNFFKEPRDADAIQAYVENNKWDKKGPTWAATRKRHFHPNVHECYAILSGSSNVLYGIGSGDLRSGERPEDFDPQEHGYGLKMTLRAGDVIIHPAGTGHSNVSEEGDYKYLAFFAEGAPHWKSPDGSELLDLPNVREETMGAAMPYDPVLGKNGHLVRLWLEARERFAKEGETREYSVVQRGVLRMVGEN